MANRCENCNKGQDYGHAVSHAKNRTFRLFQPNLQKLPVFIENKKNSAKLCMSCLKRLKKDGHIGKFFKYTFKAKSKKPPKIQKARKVSLKEEKPIKAQKTKKSPKAKKEMDISSIVGSKG